MKQHSCQKASTKVLTAKGSTNVWSKETRPTFHMTVLAAVSAAGASIPPLIIVPGKRIYKGDKAALSIEEARVTGAPKGFSNGGIFRLWLGMFAAEATKLNLQFPIVLVLDNSSTHLDLCTCCISFNIEVPYLNCNSDIIYLGGYDMIESISAAFDMEILLLALPSYATHMYQLLDVAVFRPFDPAVKDALQLKLLNTADMQLSKKDAISIACLAYRSAIIERPDNAINGFKPTGLFPPSMVHMTKRLAVYSSGGAKGTIGTGAWLKRQCEVAQLEARDELLTLPPAPGKKARLTVDIVGELVANEALD
ncbi:hypothetical protein PI125_g23588 [Phytophthora idaei]|nr:hypothetical protein PI125_g23588 [Phytophthora idaei]KAG3127964.1 hypothetical protein PI126_g21617 [Phytophthora idaei]